MNQLFERFSKRAILFCAGVLLLCGYAFAQAQPEKPAAKPQEKPAETPTAKAPEKTEEPPNAAQIELLETKYRFETNGDSRKEVHAVVKINSELGVRQFARLNFDYNRSFQSVEVQMVRIAHAHGGTSDILPSAITDVPNPAVEKFPAYHDVRVKSVRILGLQPGDSLEYRVVTATIKAPLAPDFWLDHSFDSTGVVSQETFEIEVPASLQITPKVNPNTPFASSSHERQGAESTVIYLWKRGSSVESSASAKPDSISPDVSLSTFKSWDQLAERLAAIILPTKEERSAMQERAFAISKGIVDGETNQYYDFVSQKIKTVDLPLDATGFARRKPMEILESGYASAEDKFVLFAAMGLANAGFFSESERQTDTDTPSPSRFTYLLTYGRQAGRSFWLDLNTEVAPFGMIPARLRGKTIFVIGDDVQKHWQVFTDQPIYRASQRVSVAASLDREGKLNAKVKYSIRGDSELLLRVSFHKTPIEGWKEIGQMLALSDGFRGKVTSVKTSDPYATDVPFEVEYELTQNKFVDWSKKPVRIPALLPLPGLPDMTKKPIANSKIDLGTPLDITLTGTLRLPSGTVATAPAGTSVKRDYATFTSTYSSKGNVLNFSRHLNFLLQEIPGDLSLDLNAFIHAVQSDQSQLYILDKPESVPPAKPK
jgi:hypothetical protein